VNHCGGTAVTAAERWVGKRYRLTLLTTNHVSRGDSLRSRQGIRPPGNTTRLFTLNALSTSAMTRWTDRPMEDWPLSIRAILGGPADACRCSGVFAAFGERPHNDDATVPASSHSGQYVLDGVDGSSVLHRHHTNDVRLGDVGDVTPGMIPAE
jgi:hypothetical protein